MAEYPQRTGDATRQPYGDALCSIGLCVYRNHYFPQYDTTVVTVFFLP